ncbi:VCBS domain-containing protein [Vibrio sp. Isolate22]|uniref:VCBS domain-containing protein n=1 Tax=Vibrio sp. Isolate22 TaxID=2908532 RepID=UPI001EFD7CF4|nr:VCBS domain-containing protein [Vibrio sp. Isolate22]MCG9692794.1 VCBS domain-containing protein [Vibrio sp. Isolate22]
MAKNNNVETHKKNTKIENEKSSELKPKETTKKKKLRLHSHLRVNIPLFQSLMMILPSLTKHAEATEGSGDSIHDMDLAATTPVADETIVDKHAGAAPSEATQTNKSQQSSNTTENQDPHGTNTHLVPSHHLSTLSHPQVHYIPSVSMPTISAGGNGQPTHSNTPPTPTTPVTFIPEVIKGTYGELHVDVNGQYTFILNPNSPQYILLNQHQQGTDHFALHLSNGASIVVQIPVTGNQDLPSISGDLTGVVTEDHNVDSQGLLHANGKIDVIDPDQNESSVTPEVISGKYGSLTIDANGHWQYQVDNSLSNVQALTGATSLHESFTIHTKDGTPQTIDMTIGGNDDNAVITGVDAGSVIEDLTTQVQGQFSVTDPDLGEDHFQASQVNGHLGTLTIDKDGAWTYDLDNTNPTVQALGKGATATDTVTVHSADGTPHQITVTVNGTNDKAVIGGTSSGAVTEESQLQTSGTLTITDVDTGEAHFSNTDVAGALGTLHLKDNGAWTYDLDNTNPQVQALGKGATATDTITVHSADGTPHQITVTINGTNDKAVISGTSSGSVKEETQLQTSGTLMITDVDTGEEHFSNTDVAGALGTLHLKDNGAWTYDLDNTNPKVQALGKGATATDTVTVHSADGTPHQITITVNGTNDRPAISGTSSGSVIEQGLSTAGTPDATGSLIATDIDKSDTITWAVNQPQGQWGTLSIDQNGHWHYQLDNSTGGTADKLAAGDHKSESFWITATDSAGATVPHKIVIDVQGSNDKPIVSAWTQLPAGKEDQPVTIKASDLLTHASDVDSSDVLHVTNLQATHGSLTDNKDGTYTFTPDKDFNGEIRLTYDVVDGHGGSVSTQAKFDLTATPDNAIITDAQTNANLRGVTEDRGYIDTHYQLHYDGKLNIQDPDAGEAQFDPNIGPQTYQGYGYDTKLGGHILLMRDGHYTYTLDNRNIQNLAQGEVKHDSAVIRSADGTTHTIELTVHGTNDAPTINAQSHSVTEGRSVLNGQMVGHDIDTGATLTYSAPQIDGLVVNPDGSYSFNPAHSSYQSLASGVTKTLTVPVTVTDEHNASSTQNLSITITGVNNSAVIGGVDTGDVTEGNAGQNMSPDYAQPGMAHLVRSTIDASGKLTIADTDTGEAEFDTHGLGFNYSGQYGDLLLRKDGTWFYHADTGQIRSTGGLASTRGTTIDQLGENQTLTDTITVYSKDGTSHDIVITIHGSNDRPYCASEVQLNSGKEDLAQTITATELLANTVDVDANDAGKLTIANLHADHGSIQDNHDGTYTFTPTKDYSGQVHFTYDVQDAHGGTTHTGANTTLAATPDKAIISEVTTGSVIEDGPHATHNNGTTTELANGQLQVIDPDSGEDKFQYSQFGETRIHDPFGGMLRIDSAGNWGYSVDNAALQHLAQGQVETVTYRVHSFDGTAYDLNIDVVGTNDAPTVTKVVLSNGTEDTNYQMQASQFGFTDIDTGDTLHSIAITHLPPAAQGKFVLDGHDITAGQSITASAIAKLQFVPTPNFNGDVQFKFTVNDGHVDSQEATNTLHIDAVSDAAQFTGRDTGNVHEGHTYTAPDGSMSGGYVDDRSPDHMHGNIGKIWNDEIHTDGHLNIVDPDSGESHAKTGTYQGTHGHVILQSNGDWSYYASIGQDATGRKIDHLGQGESITDTVTVKSADGTTHDIHITIHGDNDRPYCSSEVQLNSGKEDLAQTITTTELLANTVDVDTNDAGQLSIANLRADHGTLVDNKDGTFTFTPDHNFNGKVHFTYDVKDTHGGVTHTGASTTLLPSNDAATLQPTLASNFVTEDHLKSGTSTNELWSGWKNLDIHDIDSPSEAKVTQIEVNGVKHTVPANFAMNLAGAHGTFNFTHSTDGHDKWSYSADNSHTEVQSLSHGDSLTDTITLITADGTRIPLTAKILGTDDHVIIDTPDALTAALGTAIEDKVTSISGTLLAHDSDSKDSVTFSAGDSTVAYGTLHIDSNGQWHYDLDHSKANALQQGETKAEGFDITAISTDGSTATKHIEVLVQGSNDKATISVISNPDVYEDRSSTPVEIISGKLSALDPDHDQSAFSTDVGKRHDPFNSGVHGGLNISKDGSWTYTVNNSQIQQLAAGQEEHVQYNVHTVGGDYHVIDIKIVGTNDIPTVSATTLAHGTEDTHYQMQASQFGFTDIDTGDTLHSIAITDLPPAAQGKFVLNGHDITAGQSIATADIAKLQFVPATDFNGDVQFKFTVNDGHASSAEATNTLHIDAVNDAAQITGKDFGSVTEDQNVHSSVQGNYSYKLEAKGHLTAVDPDAGESGFDYHTLISAPSHPNWAPYRSALGGELEIDQQGRWHYYIDNRKPEVQSLGAGETLTDTVTIQSKDGTPHVITLTINGTNDAPVLSVTQTTPTTGTLTETDVDVKDTHTFSAVNSTGQFGSLSVDPDSGAYVYTANGSVAGMSYNATTHTYHGADVFEVKVSDNHGGESSKFITFDANGHVSVVPGQSPTISTSVPSNPLVTTTQPSLPAGTNTPPNNAVTVDLAKSSDTGTSDTDNLTKDSTPTVTGHTDIPYSQVIIYDGSTPIGHAVSDGSGQYSVAVSSLSNGDHTLSAKALAPSSVLPATSSILPLHVDTVVAPLQVSLTHDTGSNSSDLITSDGSLTITGQETGATVEYSTDNGNTWTSSFTPQQGSNTVSVRQTDIAGNVSTPTSLTFTYDDQIAAPSIDLKASTDSGVSTTDDLTNIHTPIITGTAEANSAISITDETGKVIATGTANSSGVYQLTTSDIAEGKHTLTVSSTDVAGNQSSASLPVEVDYTAPTISNVNLKTETTHQPTFSGTVSPDTTSVDIVIKSGSTIIETLHATLDGKGGYSVDATNLPDHSYTAYIQATDKAGNSTASGYAGTFDRFSVDTHASAPTISFESTGADNLYNAAEVASGAASTITSTIHLPSDAHPKDTLTINGQSHQITDAEFLAKSVNIEVAPGASITANITDKNGNTSTVTNATAPSADVTVAPLQVSLTHDTGSNSSDLITSDGSLTITGQEASATVEYSTDNGNTWTSSFTPQQGSNTVSVRQTDAAGNISADTSVTFTLDNTIAAPAVSLRNDTGRHSVNTPDLITKDSQLTIQTEAGAKVEYSNDGGHTWTAVFNPVEGVNDLQVRQTDIAGNVSPVTHFSFTLDTTPGTITVNPISQDNALNAAENNQPLVITGTTSNIAPGDVVYVVIGNKHFYDATVKPDGTWSLTLGTSIHQNIMTTDRDYSIQVGTVDTAGNSTPRISTHLLVDTQSPIPHIAVDSVTQDNVLNAVESGQTIAITGTVTGDYQAGDIVSLKINGATISSLTGSVDSSGHFSIPVAGNVLEHANIHTSYANGQSGSIHSIEATIITTDAVGNVGSATTGSQVFSVDTHVSLPTITFENPGPDGLYSKAEIAHGHPNTVTATITPPGDAKVGEHLVVNGQDHVLDAHTLQHGLQIEVNPGSQVQVTMTDEHGNTAGSQGVAASAIPEPIVVKPPSGSHQVSGTLGVPPLVPSQTPVPSAQNGWRIHLPNGQYVTSHHGQYGTLTIDPQTGHLHYQEQAQVHTGPHGSASGIGQHEDKFEIALQGTSQDEVVAHVNVQILSHGPGHSGKLTIGTEVVDMTITPIVHASHPAPPPPPPVQHDEPEIASHEDFTFTVSEDTSLDLSQHAHQEPDQKTDHHGAADYLDALGIQPNASPTTGHDQPADMDIVLAQVDQQHAADYDQTHLDMSDALEHHDAANNHNQDDEHHHHNDLDGLPDIDPNN